MSLVIHVDEQLGLSWCEKEPLNTPKHAVFPRCSKIIKPLQTKFVWLITTILKPLFTFYMGPFLMLKNENTLVWRRNWINTLIDAL